MYTFVLRHFVFINVQNSNHVEQVTVAQRRNQTWTNANVLLTAWKESPTPMHCIIFSHDSKIQWKCQKRNSEIFISHTINTHKHTHTPPAGVLHTLCHALNQSQNYQEKRRGQKKTKWQRCTLSGHFIRFTYSTDPQSKYFICQSHDCNTIYWVPVPCSSIRHGFFLKKFIPFGSTLGRNISFSTEESFLVFLVFFGFVFRTIRFS